MQATQPIVAYVCNAVDCALKGCNSLHCVHVNKSSGDEQTPSLFITVTIYCNMVYSWSACVIHIRPCCCYWHLRPIGSIEALEWQ